MESMVDSLVPGSAGGIRFPIPHQPGLVIPHYRVPKQTGKAIRISAIGRIQLLVPVLRDAPQVPGLVVDLSFEVIQPIQNVAERPLDIL